ncbi:hypothetical protein SFUMM280S_09276 [Streptomyces fumanus]
MQPRRPSWQRRASWKLGPGGAPPRGLAHQHVGSVRAVGPDAALAAARDLYTRRGDPLSLWVVRSDAVHAASPDEHDTVLRGRPPQAVPVPRALRRP